MKNQIPHHEIPEKTPRSNRSEKIKNALQNINILHFFYKLHKFERDNKILIKKIKIQDQKDEEKDKEIKKQNREMEELRQGGKKKNVTSKPLK